MAHYVMAQYVAGAQSRTSVRSQQPPIAVTVAWLGCNFAGLKLPLPGRQAEQTQERRSSGDDAFFGLFCTVNRSEWQNWRGFQLSRPNKGFMLRQDPGSEENLSTLTVAAPLLLARLAVPA